MQWDKAEDLRKEVINNLVAYARTVGYESTVPANAGQRVMAVCKTSMLYESARAVVMGELVPEIKREIREDYDRRTAKAQRSLSFELERAINNTSARLATAEDQEAALVLERLEEILDPTIGAVLARVRTRLQAAA